jgi:hypothetical protein
LEEQEVKEETVTSLNKILIKISLKVWKVDLIKFDSLLLFLKSIFHKNINDDGG